jgi:DNA-binding GntR family transcriptional regulator
MAVSPPTAAAPVADETAPTVTDSIVDALTRQITDHRLAPGARLGEQKLAEHFGVSRTLIRQALFQMGQQGLIRMEPGRGAFVATPSVDEARQVFAVRRMLESGLTRAFIANLTPAMLQGLHAHLLEEQAAVQSRRASDRVELLGDFHVLMAQLMGNEVLADMLRELISRCALITLMYQSSHAAQDSADEHAAIVQAIAQRNTDQAVALMDAHLRHVEEGLHLANAA